MSCIENIDRIISLLQNIPDVIWSGVIASLLTLGGVLISNKSNTKRLLIQLQHDANEKSKERTVNLRREVYLHAAEELINASHHLSTLPNADLAKSNFSNGFQGFFAAAAKLQVVAESNTALLASRVVAAYSEAIMRLALKAMPLNETRNDITINDGLYNDCHMQVTRIIQEMTRFNETAQTDERVFSALQRSFDNYQSQCVEYADKRDKASKNLLLLQIEFGKYLASEIQAIGKLQLSLHIEIRKDLSLTTEPDAYIEQMEALNTKMFQQFDVMVQELQARTVEPNN